MPPAPVLARPRPRLLALLLALAVFALAAWMRLASFTVVDRSPDEGLYTEFGRHIAREGPAYVNRLAHQFIAGEDVEYPWPQRIGYLSLVGLAMRVSGDTTARAPEALSTVCSLATVALTGIVAVETLGPWVAVVAMLFLAVSPLDLALSRRAWQDDVMAFVTLLMLWAFLRWLRRGGRVAWLAFFVVSALALLIKESAVIPFGLGTLGLALVAWRRARSWRAALPPLAAGALTGLCALGVVVAVTGGWSELRQLLVLAREALAPDDYLRHYQMGGVDYYLVGLGILQPVPFLLGGVGAALALLRPGWLARGLPGERARAALPALGGLVIGFGAVAFSYYSKNLRFLSPIYAPAFLLAAALVVAAATWLRARLPRRAGLAVVVVVALALAGSAALDARRFHFWFIEYQMQDLATPWYTEAIKAGDR